MLKVAIVGCGKIAEEHAQQILRVPGSRLVALCDSEPLMAMQMQERFGGVEYFDSVEELLSRARPDVVHITTPPQSHHSIGRTCIEAGCHVYVEKPFALNLAETAGLIDLAEARRVRLTVGHNYQFTNVALRMRELIDEGYIGSVAHMESYYGYNLGDQAYARAFLDDRHHWVRQLPGGLFHNIISHGIARIAEHLKSDSPRVVAHAFTSPLLRQLGETRIQDELRVVIADDTATAYFTFSTQIKPQLSMLRVYGDRNGLALDDMQHTLVKIRGTKYKSYLENVLSPLLTGSQYMRGAGANVRDFLTQRLHMSEGMRTLIEKFYLAITDDRPLPIPYREILLTARIMDDIFAQVFGGGVGAGPVTDLRVGEVAAPRIGVSQVTSVAIFTGGGDSHYAIPLSLALAARSINVEVIGSDDFIAGEFRNAENVTLHNFHGDMTSAVGLVAKMKRTLRAYACMVRYATKTDTRIFHFLWLSRFPLVDTLLLLPFFKALGKTLLFTAHNVDAGERDGASTRLNRWQLRRMYGLMDHVFVHTAKMKQQLVDQFAIESDTITVIPFGLNTAVPESHLTRDAARARLGIEGNSRVILFFGNITPYKGIEHLLQALMLTEARGVIRPTVLIAGRVKNRDAEGYYRELITLIEKLGLGSRLMHHSEYIPDEDIETYFKASDVCVLPYTRIFQSGVLFLAYRFGLPVIVSDAGSMGDDVVEGRTGFMFATADSQSLAHTLERYFSSEMFRNISQTRKDIRQLANEKYSWERIAATIHSAYGNVNHQSADANVAWR